MTVKGLKLQDCEGDYARVPELHKFLSRPFPDERIKNQTYNISPTSLPRVLYAAQLDPTLKYGSFEEQIVCLSKAFELQGSLFYPLFICPDGVGKNPFQEFGVEAECLDLCSFSWPQLKRLSRIISRHNITLVHWNFTELLRNGYVWWLTVLHPSVKHCYTDHISRTSGASLSPGWSKKVLKRLLLRRYDKVFCVSQFILNDLQRQQIHSSLVRCPQFVNTDRFRPDAEAREDLRGKFHVEGCFVVLTVAHLIKEKGIDVLIRAMSELPDSVVLWIVGEGKESNMLRQLSAELLLTSRVNFCGIQKNVAPFMQAADCFVCPSLWEEATGLVNLEATASGLPVIASRNGGMPEYVEDGRTGFLFSPGDHHELARNVRLLQGDTVLCRKMGNQARAHAIDKFTAKVGIRKYIDMYGK